MATPADYHRIISQAVSVPKDTTISVPVGLLACQRDPLLKTLETVVVSVSVVQPPPKTKEKKAKKAVIAPDVPDEPLLHILLHDTVLFPEGGGQPTDTGILTTTADNRDWEVIQVKRDGGHAVHYVRLHDQSVDAGLLAFTPGAKVTVSFGKQGFDRRYDHMSMHTSQHLLSALLESRLSVPTLSWSLTSHPSPCYVELPRGLSQDEISSVQEEANRLVFEGRRVHVEVEELDSSKREAVPTLENGRAVGKALPEDYTGGVKRVVVINGVDRNPCCGTHLPSIHNLQLFLLPHTEAISRSASTTVRLYFLAGPRLIHHLTSTHNYLSATAALLSCGAPLVTERVSQLVEERKKAEKRVSDVELELADHIAKGLLASLAAPNTEGDIFHQNFHRLDDSSNSLGFLGSVASAFVSQLPPDNKTPYLIVFSSSPSNQTSSSVTTVLVLGSNEADVKILGDSLKSNLGVKGGGKGPRWSGKYVGIWKESKESSAVDAALKQSITSR